MATPLKNLEDYNTSDYYADTYSRPGIHRAMLSDTRRTNAYREAINSDFLNIEGKTVLDVGCGTGILSLFAAQAGARKVIAIDLSGIAAAAQQIVIDNGYQDVITVIRGKIEDFESFTTNDGEVVTKVDVIVSEWMGYALLFEGMLDSVVYAREHFLTEQGYILPDQCELSITGYSRLPATIREQQSFWRSQYGFNFSAVSKFCGNPITDLLLREDLFQGTSSCLFSINLKTLTQDDLLTDIYNKEHPFSILFEPETLSSKTLSGICMYFDFTFFHQHPHERHTVSTKERTHWNHTLFHFDSDNKLHDLEDEKAIYGTCKIVKKTDCHRNFKFYFNYRTKAKRQWAEQYKLS